MEYESLDASKLFDSLHVIESTTIISESFDSNAVLSARLCRGRQQVPLPSKMSIRHSDVPETHGSIAQTERA